MLTFLSQGCLNMPALLHTTGTVVECCYFQSSSIVIVCQYKTGIFKVSLLKLQLDWKRGNYFPSMLPEAVHLSTALKLCSVTWSWRFYIELNWFAFSLESKGSQKWMWLLDSSAGNGSGVYFGQLRCGRLTYSLFWIWNLLICWSSWGWLFRYWTEQLLESHYILAM